MLFFPGTEKQQEGLWAKSFIHYFAYANFSTWHIGKHVVCVSLSIAEMSFFIAEKQRA